MSVLKYKDALGNWNEINTIKGDTGATGAQGAQGIPGVSPTVTVTDITGGHRITITDAEHPGGISFDVMDGSDADAPVQDVLINGSSIVDANGDADIPIATQDKLGAIRGYYEGGTQIFPSTGQLMIFSANSTQIKAGVHKYRPISPANQNESVFYGLSKVAGADLKNASVTLGTYPEASKSAIQNLIGGAITVSGTTPTITALPGLRYICGECSTLTVNLPASGCVDVQFESGSTPTVLTVNPATGQTVTFPVWFDDENLEADTVYEMSFADGYGAVMSWAT